MTAPTAAPAEFSSTSEVAHANCKLKIAPEAKPNATVQMTTPAIDRAGVQQNAMIAAEKAEIASKLNRPYLSATMPGKMRPADEAPLTMLTR